MGRLKKAALRVLPFSAVHKSISRRGRDYQAFKDQFLDLDPEFVELLQEKYLVYSFRDNAARIPHYKNFLAKHHVDPTQIKSKEDFLTKVPETTKKSYVFTAKNLACMCKDGDQHNISLIVKSSGHSGVQCYWAKSRAEDHFGKNALSIGLDHNFQVHEKKTLIINAFILGSWVTGINFNMLATYHCPVINVGPDKEEIFQTMNDIGAQFEQIIISGYPPFIKDLVDFGNANKFNWKRYKVHFIGGGEDFPEGWRDYIHKNAGGAKVRSGFGASDIGILGGTETDDTVFIRQLADKDPALRHALFGDVQETPMIFQYPLNLYVYANTKKEMVFTTILPEAAQPVIKYNLEDIGGTFTHKQLHEILGRFGVKREFVLPLPFMYIVGREDGPVKYNAFFVYPENIQECVYRNKIISASATGAFKFRTVFDEHHVRHLVIEFQLKKGMLKSPKLEKEFTTLIMKSLQDVNEGYRATVKKLGDLAQPKVQLYSFDDYPYKGKIKNRYS